MRRIILACLLFVIATGAGRADGFFDIYYRTYCGGGQGEIFDIGSGSPSKDGKADLSYPVVAAMYEANGVAGPGYYNLVSQPAPLPGQKAVFDNIYFWATPGTPAGNISLKNYGTVDLTPGLVYDLYLVSVPTGIAYTGPTHWGPMSYGNIPSYTEISLPYYATPDPSTSYKFRAEVTAVPEPSSLLALAGGLAGMGGILARRRR